MCAPRGSVTLFFLTPLLFASTGRAEPDVRDTRLLTFPAVSGTHVAFVYADDLWIAGVDGGNVRRLTSDIGIESHPVFSLDGKIIAFSAQYDGNTDVYTIPVEGGAGANRIRIVAPVKNPTPTRSVERMRVR